MSSPAAILTEALRRHFEVDDFQKWQYAIGTQPDEPDESITLYESDPIIAAKAMRGHLNIKPGVQIRVKGTTYPKAWNKAEAIRLWCASVLNSKVMLDQRPYVIHAIQILNGPLPLGMTETRMHEFTVNVVLTLQTA